MISEYFTPINKGLLSELKSQNSKTIANYCKINTNSDNFPNLENVKIVLFGVQEGRKAIENTNSGKDFNQIRIELYKLFPGNWTLNIADLGNIEKGFTIKDTYFAVNKVTELLLKKGIIPIIIGGGQDLTYSSYRAFDKLEQTVNVVTVDNKFDLGSIDDDLSSQSYLSKIIMDKPSNLFNFSNIGYQTYLNSFDEIELLENLFFDCFRLGDVKNSIKMVEPILRDADIVSVDISSIKSSEAPANENSVPNGFGGAEICTISRYAGISDKVSLFGIYEYDNELDIKNQTAKLISQMIWYFIEGVNYRANDYPFGVKDKYQKFIVPIDEQLLSFYKSNKTNRWWMEIDLHENNKYKKHSLIPCMHEDYVCATKNEIPERWLKTLKKII